MYNARHQAPPSLTGTADIRKKSDKSGHHSQLDLESEIVADSYWFLNTTASVLLTASRRPKFWMWPDSEVAKRVALARFCHDQRIVRITDSDRSLRQQEAKRHGVVRDVSQETPKDRALGGHHGHRDTLLVVAQVQDPLAYLRAQDPS